MPAAATEDDSQAEPQASPPPEPPASAGPAGAAASSSHDPPDAPGQVPPASSGAARPQPTQKRKRKDVEQWVSVAQFEHQSQRIAELHELCQQQQLRLRALEQIVAPLCAAGVSGRGEDTPATVPATDE